VEAGDVVDVDDRQFKMDDDTRGKQAEAADDKSQMMLDEELARRLQAEDDKDSVAAGNGNAAGVSAAKPIGSRSELAFGLGDRVSVLIGTARGEHFYPGTVYELWYREDHWDKGEVMPYLIQLDKPFGRGKNFTDAVFLAYEQIETHLKALDPSEDPKRCVVPKSKPAPKRASRHADADVKVEEDTELTQVPAAKVARTENSDASKTGLKEVDSVPLVSLPASSQQQSAAEHVAASITTEAFTHTPLKQCSDTYEGSEM
jgi:hypothetical protein